MRYFTFLLVLRSAINGRSEGVFMIIERPEDWAISKENSPLVRRRGYDQKIETNQTIKRLTELK